jgi:hypothetical protein
MYKSRMAQKTLSQTHMEVQEKLKQQYLQKCLGIKQKPSLKLGIQLKVG